MLTLSFKRKKPSLIDDEKQQQQQHRHEPTVSLEEQYRAGFRPNLNISQNNSHVDNHSDFEQNEETYPLNRFKRDVVLCLLIQGFLLINFKKIINLI